MNLCLKTLLILAVVSHLCSFSQAGIQMRIETTTGNIIVELDSVKSPITVANFLEYANSGFYNETIIHRVVAGFVIQGGGLTANMSVKPTRPPIRNEASNRLKNTRGTIAMARTAEPHSATSQFYINLKDNSNLDFKDTTKNGYGYCVFGNVIDGMTVVDSISKVKTTTKNNNQDVPVTTITVKKVTRIATPIINCKTIIPSDTAVFKIFGNRFHTIITTAEPLSFSLYNLSGTRVFSTPCISAGWSPVVLERLPAGIYVYHVTSLNSYTTTGSILKKQ